jgi:hypothetical protein
VYLWGAVLSSIALVAGTRPWWARIVLVVLATVCVAVLTRRRELGIRPVLVAIGVVTGAAVFFGPRESHDVWSYVEYGRILAIHGVSPYLHTPSQFPHDPFFQLVGWRHTPSVYGPVFTLFAALGEIVAGPSLLLARLWHQLFAAGSLAAALGIVWYETHDARSLAWLGLHPLITVSVVNGGHNDLIVGLLLLLATRALARRRDVSGGALLATAALVKVTAALGIVGALGWAWTRQGRHAARRVLIGAGAVGALGLVPFGWQPIEVLGAHPNLVSRASVWRIEHAALQALSISIPDVRLLSAVAVVGLALWLVRRHRADPGPNIAVGGAVASYQAAGPYVLPWYAGWSLPVLACRRQDPLARWAWWWAALLLAAYEIPRHIGGRVGGLETSIVGILLPVVALMTFIAVASAHPTHTNASAT